jgi:L,D-transpeptidase ErfK/SrfK
VVDKHTAVINALLKREDLANNLRMNWDMVRDGGCEDGMPVEIAVPVNGGAAPVVSSIPAELQ